MSAGTGAEGHAGPVLLSGLCVLCFRQHFGAECSLERCRPPCCLLFAGSSFPAGVCAPRMGYRPQQHGSSESVLQQGVPEMGPERLDGLHSPGAQGVAPLSPLWGHAEHFLHPPPSHTVFTVPLQVRVQQGAESQGELGS